MKKNKKYFKVYISGQITGLNLDEAKLNFINGENDALNLFSQLLHKKTNIKPINPMKLKHKENSDWCDFMEKDIAELLRCNGIYMLNNWKNSKGARIERAIAIELGLPIIYQIYNP